jgi:hypothetical protein
MPRETSESATATRKPDDKVGTPGEPPAGGGHQTPEQAAVTGMGSGGKDDTARTKEWGGAEAGRTPPAIGGSSGGHSDQKASTGPDAGEKVAGGLYKAEREDQR